MDDCIRSGVHAPDSALPGRLGLRRRAPMLYRRLMRGFYPGLSMPRGTPAIASGESPAGVVEAPEPGSVEAPDHARVQARREWEMKDRERMGPPGRRARATRVVGQFDHPVLPEPPVSIYSTSRFGFTLLTTRTAKDDDSRSGFPLVLCNRCQRSQREWRAHCDQSDKWCSRRHSRCPQIHHRIC